jgi:hypothetical protein
LCYIKYFQFFIYSIITDYYKKLEIFYITQMMKSVLLLIAFAAILSHASSPCPGNWDTCDSNCMKTWIRTGQATGKCPIDQACIGGNCPCNCNNANGICTESDGTIKALYVDSQCGGTSPCCSTSIPNFPGRTQCDCKAAGSCTALTNTYKFSGGTCVKKCKAAEFNGFFQNATSVPRWLTCDRAAANSNWNTPLDTLVANNTDPLINLCKCYHVITTHNIEDNNNNDFLNCKRFSVNDATTLADFKTTNCGDIINNYTTWKTTNYPTALNPTVARRNIEETQSLNSDINLNEEAQSFIETAKAEASQ